MSLTVEALAKEIRQIDENYGAGDQLATALLPFIERHIAAGQQGAEELGAMDEIECDLPYLFGRASLEGHESGQRLAREVQAKMKAARLATPQPTKPAGAVPLPDEIASVETSSVYDAMTKAHTPVVIVKMNQCHADDSAAWERRDALAASLRAAPIPQQPAAEGDDIAVDRFAEAMKAKMAAARAKGRGGWEGPTCNAEILSRMLRDHVEKGDPRDVANFCMMLWNRGEAIQPSPTPAADAGVVTDGWRVIPFSGSFKSGDEKWEVYGPDGSGGAIGKSDVCWPVSDLLDAIAAAPPTSPIGDSLSLHGAAGQSVSLPPASAPEVTGAFGKLIETAKLLNRSFELKLSRDDRRKLWSALGLPFGFSPNIAVIRAEAKEQFRAALTAALTEKSHG